MYNAINPKMKLKDCVGYKSDPNILYSINSVADATRDIHSLRGVLHNRNDPDHDLKKKVKPPFISTLIERALNQDLENELGAKTKLPTDTSMKKKKRKRRRKKIAPFYRESNAQL
jgi:hypothetical protein